VRRTLLAAAVVAVIGGLTGPALATTAPPVPVGVGRDAQGGVCVSAFSWVPQCVDPTFVGAQPQVSDPLPVWVYQRSDGSICAGYSTTRPVCTDPISVVPPSMALPVTVVNNDRVVGVAVKNTDGTPFVAAVVWKDGSNACIGFSYQAPICLS
jgi:hypothetical protein